ncbi:PD-(D/E)XK nuclease superfamily protein [compost metagenome]
MSTVEKHAVSKYTVRTSGRRTFRRCMRKWGFQSSMRMNLQRKGAETNIHFWFGSAIHFAMEDYFGYNKFGDPQKAFQAYYAAFKAADRPNGADEHYYLGMGMLDYFKTWYAKHNEVYQFETIWLNEFKQEVPPGTPGAKPLIESSFILDLGVKVWARQDTGEIIDVADQQIQGFRSDEGHVENFIWGDKTADSMLWDGERERIAVTEVPVCYHGTLDRLVKDKAGRWWIMDWKTAKSADTNKLDTDDQISAYMWAAEQWFGHKIHGFVYVQLTKELAKPPKRLANGTMSVDKKQKTTYALAKQMIIEDYKEVRKAPNKVIEFLNMIAAQESPEGDRYIRWDLVTRSQAQKESTYRHILGEIELMVNPNLYLYPSPTRDCIWDCEFRDACMKMDNGQVEEAKRELAVMYEPRPREEDGNIDPWRENIPWPDTDKYAAVGTLVQEMEADASKVLNIILPAEYLQDDGRD